MERSLLRPVAMHALAARFWLSLAVLVLALALVPTSGQAQSAFELDVPRSSARTRAQLTDPGDLDVARRSLVGPTMEIAAGLTVLTISPAVAAGIGLSAGPGWFPCWDDDDSDDEQCYAEAHRQQQRADRLAIGVGVTMGVLGAALVGHGAYRIHRIRRARREIALTGASLEPVLGGAALSLRGAF